MDLSEKIIVAFIILVGVVMTSMAIIFTKTPTYKDDRLEKAAERVFTATPTPTQAQQGTQEDTLLPTATPTSIPTPVTQAVESAREVFIPSVTPTPTVQVISTQTQIPPTPFPTRSLIRVQPSDTTCTLSVRENCLLPDLL